MSPTPQRFAGYATPPAVRRSTPVTPPVTPVSPPTQPVFLNNEQAARYLNLSPRTLEKHRVIGGGPRFRKFGRRVVYAFADLEAWANARACDSTSDPQYVARR
jgi:hypothetical protein